MSRNLDVVTLTGEEYDAMQNEIYELNSENKRLKYQAESLARSVMADMGNQREPLTNAEIAVLVDVVYKTCGHLNPTPELIVRAIERAHGIGA